MEHHQFQLLFDESKKQTRLLNRIKNNVVFWFWLTIVAAFAAPVFFFVGRYGYSDIWLSNNGTAMRKGITTIILVTLFKLLGSTLHHYTHNQGRHFAPESRSQFVPESVTHSARNLQP